MNAIAVDTQSVLQGRVRGLCAERQVKAKDIAPTLTLTPQAFLNKRSGRRDFTVNELVVIADFFGVSVDYLLGRDEEAECNA